MLTKEQFEQLANTARNQNSKQMIGCLNRGKDFCCAPFCDYCMHAKTVGTIPEVIAKWRGMTERTAKFAEEYKTNHEGKAAQTDHTRVCELVTEILDEVTRAYEYSNVVKEGEE